MNRKGELRIDPVSLPSLGQEQERAGTFDVVVPYTSPDITARVVRKAAALAAGLNATLKLVAVYVAPYPAELRCPASMQEHLTARLSEIAERSPLPAHVHLAVARDRAVGFGQILKPASAVLMGSRKRWWRTREERLARELAHAGHSVTLLYF